MSDLPSPLSDSVLADLHKGALSALQAEHTRLTVSCAKGCIDGVKDPEGPGLGHHHERHAAKVIAAAWSALASRHGLQIKSGDPRYPRHSDRADFLFYRSPTLSWLVPR